MIEGTVTVTGTVKIDRSHEVDNMLQNAIREFEADNVQNAYTLCSEILNIDSQNATAIIYKALSLGCQASIEDVKIAIVMNEYFRAFEIMKKQSNTMFDFTLGLIEPLNQFTQLASANFKLYKNYMDSVKIEIEEYGRRTVKRIETAYDYYDKLNIKNESLERIATMERNMKNVCSTGIDNLTKCMGGVAVKVIGHISDAPQDVCEGFWPVFSGFVEATTAMTASGFVKKETIDFVNNIVKGFDKLSKAAGLLSDEKQEARYALDPSSIIPLGTTIIEDNAFDGWDNLTEIMIPDSVTSIGNAAFQNCINLTSVTIPNSVTSIGNLAFEGCTSLTSVTIPDSITSINNFVFAYCESLASVTIPDSVTSIGASAFEGCINLTNLTIPKSVTSIGEDAFKGCDELNANGEIDVDDNTSSAKSGCYVATCVYGSYDCPQVWTLRRYRDDTLGSTWYGRLFIRTYYAISPTLVKWFGKTNWFKKLWRGKLDRMVAKLQNNGVEDTPYQDKEW